MIKRKPTKAELKDILSYKLAMVVTKDYERILIGSEASIKHRLSGQANAEVMLDKIRPFGSYLLRSNTISGDNWNIAIFNLYEAQSVLHNINPTRHFSTENVLYHEGIAQDILTEFFDSDDPISQFVALQIWYGYWAFREKRSADECRIFLDSMQNLIRPFAYDAHYIEDGNRVTASNSIFRHVREHKSYDKEQIIYHLDGTEDIECIIIDKSLIPLEKYYITQFSKWTKYLIQCRICEQYFFVESRKNKLCSQACRDQAHKNTLVQRKENEQTASIDQILANARAHWYNRLRKLKSSNEWSKEDVEKYEAEKDRFLKECREKRKAHKNGKISFGVLQDWLLHQEVRAQEVLESLMVTKR